MSSLNLHSANSVTTVIDRIRSYYKFATDAEVAEFLEISPSTLSTWKRRQTLNYDLVIAKCKEIDLDWLFKGKSSVAGDGMADRNDESAGRIRIPLFLCPIPAGAPTPGDDYVESTLDVTALVIPNPESCFAVRVTGDSMTGAGIETGDYVVVDRSRAAASGSIVVCAIDGELTLKRLEIIGPRTFLFPDNEKYHAIEIREGMTVIVWGVAIRTIRAIA